MNGFVLWISGFATSDTHSASNGSPALFNDLARLCSDGARRGEGDAFFTICPSHCSGFGRGEAVSIGTTTLDDVATVTVEGSAVVALLLPPALSVVLLLRLLPLPPLLWLAPPSADRSSVCCLLSGERDRGGMIGPTDKVGRTVAVIGGPPAVGGT